MGVLSGSEAATSALMHAARASPRVEGRHANQAGGGGTWVPSPLTLEQAHQYVSKMFDRCLDVAVLSYMLYGHEIVFGSCGFVQDNGQDNGKIYQEFGNFRDYPDY